MGVTGNINHTVKAIIKPLLQNSLRQAIWYNLIFPPKHLVIEVTRACNFRCVYCLGNNFIEAKSTQRPMVMPHKLFKDILAVFMNQNVRLKDERPYRIIFYGGEPLMQLGQIMRFCETARRLAIENSIPIEFSMTTNGSLLDSDARTFLANNDFALCISVDGPARIHNYYRPFISGNGSFEEVFKNLVLLALEQPEYFKKRVAVHAVLNWRDSELSAFDIEHFFSSDLLSHARYVSIKIASFEDNSSDRVPTLPSSVYNYRYANHFGFSESFIYRNLFASKQNRSESYRENHHHTLNLGGQCVPFSDRIYIDNEGSIFLCEKARNHIHSVLSDCA